MKLAPWTSPENWVVRVRLSAAVIFSRASRCCSNDSCSAKVNVGLSARRCISFRRPARVTMGDEPVDCLARGTWGHLSDERKCARNGDRAPKRSVLPHGRRWPGPTIVFSTAAKLSGELRYCPQVLRWPGPIVVSRQRPNSCNCGESPSQSSPGPTAALQRRPNGSLLGYY